MKSISIKLSERVFEELKRIAKTAEVPVDDLTTDIVVDAVFAGRSSGKGDFADDAPAIHLQESSTAFRAKSVTGREAEDTRHGTQRYRSPVANGFSVAGEFPDREKITVDQAQKFVDAALDYENVRAFKNDEGIDFDANFVFIERVYSKETGFSASFYGRPEKFSDYGTGPGRKLQPIQS